MMQFHRAAVPVLIALAVAASTLLGCGSKTTATSTPEKKTLLRVGLIPNIAPEEQKTKYEPLRLYLEQELGRPVELFVASNYTGVVQAMVSGKLDLAYFGGLTYAQALQQVDVEPIVTEIDAETGTEKYFSLIIAGKDSGVSSLGELAGRSFAFGDPSSTSGSLYPRKMLSEAGYDWEQDFAPIKQVVYSGGHDATARAVENGSVAAGGIEGRVLARLEKDGKIDASRIKVIDKRLVQGYPWCVAASMDEELKEGIRKAFLDIDDPALLDLLRARRYVSVDADDYAELRADAERLGLLNPAK
ncbi:MAG: putative selenate ABC transporter substrate-binding protein [Coriobacteriaceae bacterium]|nr:putative selenate ABC transporter substrate-binding protein [Coriobacteriaceae bacterium]